MISQINRSSVSIPSNIAEGAGRNTNGEFNQFLGIASGSLFELETQIIIASKLNFIDEVSFNRITEDIESIRKLIYGLKKSLK